MKRFIFAILLVMLPVTCKADEWTKTDVALQGTYTILHTIDWLQTRWISGGRKEYIHRNHTAIEIEHRESNVILGKRPSKEIVDAYFASTLVAHTAISYFIPSKYRTYCQGATIVFEGYVVGRNFSVGAKVEF